MLTQVSKSMAKGLCVALALSLPATAATVTNVMSVVEGSFDPRSTSCVTTGTRTSCDSNFAGVTVERVMPAFDTSLGTLNSATVRITAEADGIFILRGNDISAPGGSFRAYLATQDFNFGSLSRERFGDDGNILADFSDSVTRDSTVRAWSIDLSQTWTFTGNEAVRRFATNNEITRKFGYFLDLRADVNTVNDITCTSSRCGATARMQNFSGLISLTYDYTPLVIQPPAVPLPASGWLLTACLGALAWRGRKAGSKPS